MKGTKDGDQEKIKIVKQQVKTKKGELKGNKGRRQAGAELC